jgi:hypothetical protein
LEDSILGYCYLSVDEFKERASAFGAGGIYVASFSDPELTAALASASRLIDAYTNREFNPNPQIEIQHVDYLTQRIRVNKPPVTAIASCLAQTYPTPTAIDVSTLVVVNQQNYIYIPGISLLPPGVANYPDVEITYTSGQELPPKEVKIACGFTAAEVIRREYGYLIAPAGLNELSTIDQTVSRQTFNPQATIVPEEARQALSGAANVAVRITPLGYPSRTTRFS